MQYFKYHSIQDIDGEKWVDIPSYEGHYMVSNLGRVKSIKCNHKIIKSYLCNTGYVRCSISKMDVRRQYSVHRLVALSFILNPLNKPQVNHINGVKYDNRLENLEWATEIENAAHAQKTGLINHSIHEKKVYQYNVDGELVNIWRSAKHAKEYGHDDEGIYKCCRGVSKYSNGYIWSRVELDKSYFVNITIRDSFKRIGAYDSFGNLVKEYRYLSSLSVDGYSKASISRVIKSCKKYKGYYWKKI